MIKKLRSFNEKIQVDFDVEAHTYHHEGTQFFSASTFAGNYGGDDFESRREEIALGYSQKYNVDMDDLMDMWSSNGDVARNFGTVIHAAMEHYFTYKEMGQHIFESDPKKEQNAALPNHPFLRDLILEVESFRQDGPSIQEAFVTLQRQKKCGQIDDLLILDRKKKVCRIRDYKITVDILEENHKLKAPFAYLGGSKLSKNFVQLAFYGYLLQSTGWIIEGVDIYNWCDGWSVYTLEGTELMKTMLLVGNNI